MITSSFCPMSHRSPIARYLLHYLINDMMWLQDGHDETDGMKGRRTRLSSFRSSRGRQRGECPINFMLHVEAPCLAPWCTLHGIVYPTLHHSLHHTPHSALQSAQSTVCTTICITVNTIACTTPCIILCIILCNILCTIRSSTA